MLRSKLKYIIFACFPTLFLLLAAEVLARVELRLRHGYSYAEALAYLQDPALVYRNNPRHYQWKDRPGARFELFFIPTPPEDGPRPRILVLGGSTSEARHDGSDWPSVMQSMSGSTVINFGYSGYGTGQLRILYERYKNTVKPDFVILFSGWNLRGSVTSPLGWRPANTSSQFDGRLQRLSALLINNSAFYGRLWHWVDNSSRVHQCESKSIPVQELAAWENEYRALARQIIRDRELYIVVPPSLTLRLDAIRRLPPHLDCIERKFEVRRQVGQELTETMGRIAREVGATPLDMRPAYMRLPVEDHVSFFTDEIHQTAEGNRYLGETLYMALSQTQSARMRQ